MIIYLIFLFSIFSTGCSLKRHYYLQLQIPQTYEQMMSAEPSAHEASNPKNKKQYGYYQPTGFHLYCDDGPLLDSCKSLQSGNAAGALKTLLKAKLADGQRYKVMNNKAAAYLLNQDIRSAENHLLTAGNIADSDYDNTVIRNNLRILTNLNPYYSIPRSPDALP